MKSSWFLFSISIQDAFGFYRPICTYSNAASLEYNTISFLIYCEQTRIYCVYLTHIFCLFCTVLA